MHHISLQDHVCCMQTLPIESSHRQLPSALLMLPELWLEKGHRAELSLTPCNP